LILHDRFFEILKDVNCPIEILEKLSKNYNVHIRRVVARHPKTSLSILESLCEDEDKFVLINIVYNENSTLEILEKIFINGNGNENIYSAIAKNIKCNESLFIKIIDLAIKHEYADTFCLVSESKNLTTNIINKLFDFIENEEINFINKYNYKLYLVLEFFILNENCSFNILKKIYKKIKKQLLSNAIIKSKS